MINYKQKALEEDFTSTIQDIEVCVKGDFTPADRGVGIDSSYYTVTHIWLPMDMQQQNLIELIGKPIVLSRLESLGNELMSDRQPRSWL